MRRDAARGVLSAVAAGTAGVTVLAQASAAYADMGFSPGDLRDALHSGQAQTGQFLLIVMAFAALASAAVGLLGLRRMSRCGPGPLEPCVSEGRPLDE